MIDLVLQITLSLGEQSKSANLIRQGMKNFQLERIQMSFPGIFSIALIWCLFSRSFGQASNVPPSSSTTSKYQVLPTPEKGPRDPYSYKLVRLANGMTVMAVQNTTASISHVSFTLNNYALTDVNALRYSPFFLSYIRHVPTEKYPIEGQFFDFFSSNPKNIAISSSNGLSLLNFSTHVSKLAEALDRFSSCLTCPQFERSLEIHEQFILGTSKFIASFSFEGIVSRFCCKFAKTDHVAFISEDALSRVLSDKNVHQRFQHFYQNHFSAHLLTIVVEDSQTPDKIVEMVAEKFGTIPNREKVPQSMGKTCFQKNRSSKKGKSGKQSSSVAPPPSSNPTPKVNFPFEPTELMTLSNIYSNDNNDSLTFAWQIPYSIFRLFPMALYYVTVLFCDKKDSNILKYLKENNLATSCYWFTKFFNDSVVYFLRIILTPKGKEEHEKVAQIVFAFLALLKESPVQSWVYQKIEQNYFGKFENFSNLNEYSINIILNVQMFPSEHTLRGRFWLGSGDDDLMKQFLDQFNVENVQLFLSSNLKNVTPKSKGDPVLCIYYDRRKMSSQLIKSLRQAHYSAFPTFQLLPIAIEKKISSVDGESSRDIKPVVLIPGVMWSHNFPASSESKNHFSILLQFSSVSLNDCNDLLYGNIFVSYYMNYIQSKLHSIANEFRMDDCLWSKEGIGMQFSGKPDVLIQMVKLVLSDFFLVSPEKDLFEKVLENILSNFEIFAQMSSFERMQFQFSHVLYHSVSVFEQISKIKETKFTFAEFSRFILKLSSSEIKFKIFASGNVQVNELYEAVDDIRRLIESNRKFNRDSSVATSNKKEEDEAISQVNAEFNCKQSSTLCENFVKIQISPNSNFNILHIRFKESFGKVSSLAERSVELVKRNSYDTDGEIEKVLSVLQFKMIVLRTIANLPGNIFGENANLAFTMIEQLRLSVGYVLDYIRERDPLGKNVRSALSKRNEIVSVGGFVYEKNQKVEEKDSTCNFSNLTSYPLQTRIKSFPDKENLFFLHHEEENSTLGILFHCFAYDIKSSLLIQLFKLGFEKKFLSRAKKFQFDDQFQLQYFQNFNDHGLAITVVSKTRNCFFMEMVIRNFIKQVHVYVKRSLKFKQELSNYVEKLRGIIKNSTNGYSDKLNSYYWSQILSGNLELNHIDRILEVLSSITVKDFVELIENYLLPSGENLKYFSIWAFNPKQASSNEHYSYGNLSNRKQLD